jgi:two-component system alkaline phosphatase synthesis response regulator PhoP
MFNANLATYHAFRFFYLIVVKMNKILVVDDDPGIRYAIKEGFFTEYDVKTAESGKKCFRCLESEIPALILLDIMMPEINGWEVIKRLKDSENWKEIPIIIITARSDETTQFAGSFFANDLIEKPFTINDLKKRINKVLYHRK